MKEAWKATTKLHIHDFISYVCNTWLTFWSIGIDIGIVKLDRFNEIIGLKWQTFRKGMFEGSSIAWQIYHLESWYKAIL